MMNIDNKFKEILHKVIYEGLPSVNFLDNYILKLDHTDKYNEEDKSLCCQYRMHLGDIDFNMLKRDCYNCINNLQKTYNFASNILLDIRKVRAHCFEIIATTPKNKANEIQSIVALALLENFITYE